MPNTDDFPTTVSLHPRTFTVWIRAALLALVAILLLLASSAHWVNAIWWGLLVLSALPGMLLPGHPFFDRAGRFVEVLATCIVAVYATDASGASLPYLVAPVLASGLFVGFCEAGLLVGLAVVVLTAAGASDGVLQQSAFALQSLEWLLMAIGGGLLGSRIRAITLERQRPESEYAQATRLLTQLRTIARQLPGTLDPGSIAERLLSELATVAPADRSAVFTASGGGRLDVLAQRAEQRVPWETSLDADTAIAEAWASQRPQVTARTLARSPESGPRAVTSALVLPLVTGVRTVGLVALEADRLAAYSPTMVSAAAKLAASSALRLETALLFDEVRSLATTEERQRLAREIHDGVAQELVMVGYGIDNAVADLPAESPAAEQLTSLRSEVTRVITELRLSLFELRSDVDRHGGLGSAIAEYARTVGTSAGLRVHLSLDESTARLPAAIESELLRIAQEAITNARKHARATNLWVSCEVDPPNARITVSDDGTGIAGGARRQSSYGMSIMAERAEQIRARLTIEPRKPSGTTVTAILGGVSESRQGSVSAEQEVDSGNVSNTGSNPNFSQPARETTGGPDE